MINKTSRTLATAIGITAMMALLTICRADNPTIQTNFTADPAPMVHDGTVYLYVGHDEDDARGFLMRDWLCYTSTDMVNWTDHGAVASLKDFKWAERDKGGFDNGAWALQCIARNGKFYMYCPVEGRGIGVLVADSPFGPFTDPIGKPMIGANYDSIDPTVFIDEDGQAYLYWGNPNLWYVKLNKDMVSYSGEITKDISIAKVPDKPDPFHYQEGPWAYKRNGHYYMAYASTCCPEGIGYAMGKSPTGPWEFKGYIMKPNNLSSGNHPGIIDYKGKSYVFGFNYTLNRALTSEHRERRSVCVSEMTYNPDGTINELPWWKSEGVAQIGTLDPYRRTEAETIAYASGIKTERHPQGGMDTFALREGAYIKVKGVNFGTVGAAAFTASVASDTRTKVVQAGTVELHLDRSDGRLIGTLPIPYTGGASRWEKATINIAHASGVHDLFLVFRGAAAENLARIDSWQFTKKSTVTKIVRRN